MRHVRVDTANLGSVLGSSVSLSGAPPYRNGGADRKHPTNAGDATADSPTVTSPTTNSSRRGTAGGDMGLQVVRVPDGDLQPAEDSFAERGTTEKIVADLVSEQMKAQRYVIEASADDLRGRLNTVLQAFQEQQKRLYRMERLLTSRPSQLQGKETSSSRNPSKESATLAEKRREKDPSPTTADSRHLVAALEKQLKQKQATVAEDSNPPREKQGSPTVLSEDGVDGEKVVVSGDRGPSVVRSRMASLTYHYNKLGVCLQSLHSRDEDCGSPGSLHDSFRGIVLKETGADEVHGRDRRRPRSLSADVARANSSGHGASTGMRSPKVLDKELERITHSQGSGGSPQEKVPSARRPSSSSKARRALDMIFGPVPMDLTPSMASSATGTVSNDSLERVVTTDLTDAKKDRLNPENGVARVDSCDALDKVLQATERARGSRGKTVTTSWNIRKNSASLVSGAILMMYLIFLGYRADHEMRVLHGGAELQEWPAWLEILFSVALIIEIGVTMVKLKSEFFVGSQAAWRWFDAFLVVCTICDLLATAWDSQLFKVTRLFRAIRAAQAIRSVRYVRDLRLMVAAIIVSFSSFLWAIALLAFIIYTFAIFIMLTLQHLHHKADTSMDCPSELCNLYGTLPAVMVSLFEAITGGEDWWKLLEPLHATSRMYSIFYIVYITFVLFGLLNILFAMFVKNTADVASIDKELVINEELNKKNRAIKQFSALLHKADVDEDGVISIEELEEMLENDELVVHLREAEMDTADLRILFNLLDYEDTGEVHVKNFVDGMVRLKGQAKAMDTENIMSENKRIQVRLGALSRYIEDRMDLQDDRLMNFFQSFASSKSLSSASLAPATPLGRFGTAEANPKKISEYVNDEEASGRANMVVRLQCGSRGTRADAQSLGTGSSSPYLPKSTNWDTDV